MGKRLRVKPSTIHGIGLFADEFIAKEDRIAGVRMVRVGRKEEFASLPTTGFISAEGDVYGVVEGFPLWYVNYSADPNIQMIGPDVYAIKSIAQGDELTLKEPEDGANS